MELSIFFGDDLGFRGKLIVNNIRNVRRNLSVLFTTRQTSKRIWEPATVSDRIQIPPKTTYKDSDRNKGKCILLFY